MNSSQINYFKIAQYDFCEIEKIFTLRKPFCLEAAIEQKFPFNEYIGYRTKKPLQIMDFRSKESVFFDFEVFKGIRLNSVGKPVTASYRYCLRWHYDIITERNNTLQDDYLQESMIILKRSIRFDYHPNIDSLNPLELNSHWHPNGCSEIKKETPMLEPIHAVAFGAKFFAPDIYGRFSSDIRNIVDSIF